MKQGSHMRPPAARMPMIPELCDEMINPKVPGPDTNNRGTHPSDGMSGIQINESHSICPAVPIPVAFDRPNRALSNPSVATLSDGDVQSVHSARQSSRRSLPTLHSGLSQFSLTPSDLQNPMPFLRSSTLQDRSKAERMLGLRESVYVRPNMISQATQPLSTSEYSSSITALPKYENDEHEATSDRKENPLNGRTAWLHAVCGMLIVFNCWGMANLFGILQAYYEAYYLPPGTSPSSISWVGSTQLALIFGLGSPVGHLVDRGYFRLVFHGGSAIMVLGIFCTAWCKAVWSLFLVQGLMTGLGMGMVFGSALLALSTWFDPRTFGAAVGIAATGSCIGGTIFIVASRHFLLTHGFATTMRILGGIAVVVMIPPNLIYRMRKQHRPVDRRKQHRPKLSVKDFTARPYLLAAGGMFFAFLGVYFGFVYIVSFASTELKLSTTAATNLPIFMLAANLPGRLLPGLISDRCLGPLNTVIPGLFLSAGCVALWMSLGDGHNTGGALTVIACFYGFASAGLQALYAPAVMSLCLKDVADSTPSTTKKREEPGNAMGDPMGLKSGVIYTCIGFACLIGTPIGGALVKYRTDKHLAQPYLGAQIFTMLCLLLGGALLLASRVARVGWRAQRA